MTSAKAEELRRQARAIEAELSWRSAAYGRRVGEEHGMASKAERLRAEADAMDLQYSCPCPDPLRAVDPSCPAHGLDIEHDEGGSGCCARGFCGPERQARFSPQREASDARTACIVDEDGGVCGEDDCPRCGAPSAARRSDDG